MTEYTTIDVCKKCGASVIPRFRSDGFRCCGEFMEEQGMIDIQELELEFNAFYGDKENEHTLLSRMFPLIAEVKRLRKREATFDEFIDSLDVHKEHEWVLIERIDEIHNRLHGGGEQ